MRLALKVSSPMLALLLGVTAVAAADQPMIGQPAPGFDLPALDGTMVKLSDLSGKLVVLHFGAGW